MADQYYNNVVLLVPGIGANNGTTIQDWSKYTYDKRISTVTGTSGYTSTSKSKYYGSSLYVDGTNSATVQVRDTAVQYNNGTSSCTCDCGSGDWTVEAWVYLNGAQNLYASLFSNNASVFQTGCRYIMIGSTLVPRIGGNFTGTAVDVVTAPAMSTDVWTHLAFVRSGNNFRIFVNGVSNGTTGSNTYSWDWTSGYSQTGPHIGRNLWDSTNGVLKGWIQDFRLTKGVARYWSNFTPPDQLMRTISGTVKDDTNTLATRTIAYFPRISPSVCWSTTSTGGSFSAYAPDVECSVVCLDDAAGTTYNDLVSRI